MDDALFMPSAETKTEEKAEETAAENRTEETIHEGTTPNTTVAPFIVPANAEPASDASSENAEEGPSDETEQPAPSADTEERQVDAAEGTEGPENAGSGDGDDSKAIGPGEPLSAKEATTTPLSFENKTQIMVRALKNIEQSVHNLIALLETDLGDKADSAAIATLGEVARALPKVGAMAHMEAQDGGRVIEGVFNGHNMVGSDGKIYTVPPNYASKSKLVEGDLLKLTITPKGSFIYKQIGPIERSRVIGSLGYDQTNGEWYASSDNRRWSVIKASVTYFKGEPGDEIVLLIPKNEPSKWAAVENIIKKDSLV